MWAAGGTAGRSKGRPNASTAHVFSKAPPVRTQLIITTITRVVSGFIVHEATSTPKNTLLQVVAVRWDKAWDRLKGTLTALGWVS
jgi:hypothetical protein